MLTQGLHVLIQQPLNLLLHAQAEGKHVEQARVGLAVSVEGSEGKGSYLAQEASAYQ